MNYQFLGVKQTKKPLVQSRVELFLQFEACIRQTTLWELIREKQLSLGGIKEQDQEYKVSFKILKYAYTSFCSNSSVHS